jgi:predicted glutamine amidotransferase
MCEIAVVNPDELNIEATHQMAATFAEEQGDGLGVVAVLNEGDRFEYKVYKSTQPHWQTLYAFLKRNYSRAWRIVVHARYATSGKVNRDTAHPIKIDCDTCDFEWVVHNGSVRRYDTKFENLLEDGHQLNTGVDTEVIPHTISKLPETVDDHSSRTYRMYGNLNYLVFSEDGILVRSDSKYHVSDDFTMTCSPKKFRDAEEAGFDTDAENGWLLIEPDGAEPAIETKERTTRSRYSSSGAVGGTTARGSWGGYEDSQTGERRSSASESDESETYTIEYNDFSSYEHISAVRVAPNVIKIIDTDSGKTTFLNRFEDTKLFYHYAPEETPDNVDALDEMRRDEVYARIAGDDEPGEQAQLSDFPSDAARQAINEEVKTAVAQEVESVTIRDMAEIDDALKDAIDIGMNTVEGVNQYEYESAT